MSQQRIAFVLEHSLGHATHAQNLKRVLEGAGPGIEPAFIDLNFDDLSEPWQRLPLVRSNWSVRASLGARRALARLPGRRPDAVLFHTQVTSLFSTPVMRTVPAVVSLDATPHQIDAQGEQYGHTPSQNARLEAFKKGLNRRAFGAARHLVAWSEWAKSSLVSDYGIPGNKVTVIPPGVDRAAWTFPGRPRPDDAAPVRFLFVGGDFARKGGDTLLAAYAALPAAVRSRCRLDIVTKTEGVAEGMEGVSVHHGVTPNSPRLRELFAGADAFAFPTRGDCLPLAVLEAMMAGLPVLTTSVGALPEAVGAREEAGLVLPPDDVAALAAAMGRLVADGALRRGLGLAARRIAEERFDAAINYRRLVDVVRGAAAGEFGPAAPMVPAPAAGRRSAA